MKRRAPKGGYDFGPKRNYRRAVWGGIRDGLADLGRHIGSANVMMMPSIEGDEIKEAIKRGAAMQRMHVVDQNPAIVAHLRRRYPELTTYGVDVRRAMQRAWDKDIHLDAINLDLCGPCTDEALRAATDAAIAHPRGCVVGITMLRGRETAKTATVWHRAKEVQEAGYWRDTIKAASVVDGGKAAGDGDYARLVAFLHATHQWTSVTLKRWGIYKSTAGNQTMLWAVAVVGYHEVLMEKAISVAQAVLKELDKTRRLNRAMFEECLRLAMDASDRPAIAEEGAKLLAQMALFKSTVDLIRHRAELFEAEDELAVLEASFSPTVLA